MPKGKIRVGLVRCDEHPRGWNGFHCDVYSGRRQSPPSLSAHFRSEQVYEHEFVGGALSIWN